MILQYFDTMPLIPKSHAFVLDVYRTTQAFPKHETFGLISQLRRAAVSIPANICEGKGHNNDAQMNRFLNIARASLSEACYYLVLARDLVYISDSEFKRLYSQAEELGRMTAGLQNYLKDNIEGKTHGKQPSKV